MLSEVSISSLVSALTYLIITFPLFIEISELYKTAIFLPEISPLKLPLDTVNSAPETLSI